MFSIKNEKPWLKLTLLVIITFFLSLNLFAIFKYGHSYLLGNFEKMNNDDVRYVGSAITLLDKGMFTDNDPNTPTVDMMPGHVFILAPLIKLFGTFGGMTAFRILQAFLQALSMYMMFLIGRYVANSYTGLAACLIDAFYIPEVYNVGLVLTEVEFKTFLLLLVLISLYAVNTKKTSYYVYAGLVWGAACLIRPTIALYPAAILVFWLIKKYSFKEILKYGAITTAVFCVVMSPWWIRNYITFQRFIPLTLATGNPFLQGTYINYDQSKDFVYYTPDKDMVKNDATEMQTGLYRLKTYFKQHPLEYLRWYTIGKTDRMWHRPFYWKIMFGIQGITALKYHLFIMVFSIFGMLGVFLKKNHDGRLLFLTVLYFTLIYLPFYTFDRYAYPVMPAIMILSAIGLVNLIYNSLTVKAKDYAFATLQKYAMKNQQ